MGLDITIVTTAETDDEGRELLRLLGNALPPHPKPRRPQPPDPAAMPKTSAIQKNEKRKRLVEKYAKVRAELKAVLANPATTDEQFFAAQTKLQKLPKNSSSARIRNRCSMSGRPARLQAQVRRLPHPVPRARARRQDPRRHQIILVNTMAHGGRI